MGAAAGAAALLVLVAPVRAQHGHAGESADTTNVWMMRSAGGWAAMGMAQVFPTYTWSLPATEGTPLERQGVYATQAAAMVNVASPDNRFVLRTTLNFEAWTQRGGELTYGGWGEGFIDKRHPHTLLHELMLSVNVFRSDGMRASVSAGKGFTPYGTDDPMSRPVLKYPTNHHLSQIVERWTLNGVLATESWSFEAGVFSGNEPTGPYDLGNTDAFGRSWSARVTRRFGSPIAGSRAWEVSASAGRVMERQHDAVTRTILLNAALRHEQAYPFGRLYALAEFSVSEPGSGDGHYAAVLEGSLRRGDAQPYFRVERATRPEYERNGTADTRGFFRYDHHAEATGASRWTIVSAGLGWTATRLPVSVRPYAEAQYHAVSRHRGTLDPARLYGRSRFWAFSAGFRIFVGGDPMRMGAYGVLDPMTIGHGGVPDDTATQGTERH